MRDKISKAMVGKSQMLSFETFYKSLYAGVFIGLGGFFYSLLANAGYRALGAMSFSIGLILIVFTGSQLFTGNNLLIIPLIEKKVLGRDLLRNWILVYLGNLLGSFLFVFAILLLGPDLLDEFLIKVSTKKLGYSFSLALQKAVLCNILVCIAVSFAIYFEKKWQKILGIIVPISLFVYLGFEHSVANMFFVPIGLLEYKINSVFLFEMWKNLIPVTLGNIIGGVVLGFLIYFIGRKRLPNS